MLAMLQQKTEGNRTPEESDELEAALHELRLAYVTISDEASRSGNLPLPPAAQTQQRAMLCSEMTRQDAASTCWTEKHFHARSGKDGRTHRAPEERPIPGDLQLPPGDTAGF